MGLPPFDTNNLRKKKGLAKQYINCLVTICKAIEKGKAEEEELLRLDVHYKKLKKAEERYGAYIE
jgi:hypothetical protein